MNESKKQGEQFTPGPWELDFFRRDIIAGEKRIAKVHTVTWRDQIRRADNDGSEADYEEIANATLISAAPELLAALESLAVWRDGEPCFCHVHGEGEPMNRWLFPPHNHEDYCQAARAAIAKAKKQ